MERSLTTILDFETNGFQGSDILSMGLRHSNGEIINRYYYPQGEYNEEAIKINGLTEEKITELRGDAPYSLHFCNDTEVPDMFLATDTLVAHNIAFDYSFLPWRVKAMPLKLFCTMKANTKYFEKNPKLKEACEHYGIELEEDLLHGAAYDAKLCHAIYDAMKEEDKAPNKDFLTKVYAGYNGWGDMVHPFGSLKGMSVNDMNLADLNYFLSKYHSSDEHEMFDEVQERFISLENC